MKIERTKNAKRGIAAGTVLRVCQTVLPFLMRTAMIQVMGVSYLGINSLFSSILHILNLAELGVGAAMVYSMYKPVAEDDEQTICALMNLYRKYYRIIGVVVGLIGLSLLPVLPHLVSGDVPSELSINVLYLLNLGATVLSYWLFAYRNCLLQAHQRVDVISIIAIFTSILEYAFQFSILFLFKNYYLYVIVILFTQIINNVFTALVTKKMYPQYKAEGYLPKEEVCRINQKVKDIFTGKIGAVVLNSSDSIVISSFLGLRVLALFQNYYFIMTSVINMINIILSSAIAGLGNSFLTETKQKNFLDLEKFTFLLLWLTGICTCCFLAMYQPFMRLWVGETLLLENKTVFCFALYFAVYVLNRLLNVYKDAAGLWHEDRFRPLITAAVNLSLNLIMVQFWQLDGVLLSTVASMLIVGIPWLLWNLFTLFFDRKHIKDYIAVIISFSLKIVLASMLVWQICEQIKLSDYATLVFNAGIAVVIPNVVFFLFYRNHRLFPPSVQFLDRLTKGKLKLAKRLLPNNV